MAIIEKDGFKFLNGLNSDFIVIESDRFKQYLDYIKNNNISSNSEYGVYSYAEYNEKYSNANRAM